MGKIIAITNQKGGVGKTTTSINLTSSLGENGKKVLLVDVDPQGNSTSGLGVNKRDVKASTYHVMVGEVDVRDAIIRTEFKNVSLLPSNIDLAGAEIELVDMENREKRLKDALTTIRNQYDYIIIDCPPSLGLITINALCATDTIIVPIQCEYYALEGLSQLINTVRQIKKRYNEMIDIEGVLLTMYDGRLNLTQQVVTEVKKYFPRKIYSAAIPRTVRLSEAPSYGQPINYFDKRNKGAIAYDSLAKEIIEKNR